MSRNSKKEERRVKVKSHMYTVLGFFFNIFFLLTLTLQVLIMTLKCGGLEVPVGHSFICILNLM